jgi:sigma-B regulation protein RsbQ
MTKNVLVRNNVRVIGKGVETIIFAHGFGCDQNTWRSVVAAFKDDYKLVLFDFVGAGKSDLTAYDPNRYSSLNGYASDILDICEALQIKEANYVGHSVSSMIGLLAANREPSYFKKMVFIGPSARYINDSTYQAGMEKEDLESLLEVMDSNYLGWSQMIAPRIMGDDNDPDLQESLTNSFCATDPEIAKRFARATFLSDNRKDLPLLKVESLSLQTYDDLLAPEAASQYILEHTPGNTRVVINATGHCPHLSAPDEVINAIKSYLN